MFASKSLSEHLLRGALGIAALAGALLLSPAHSWALLLLPVGFVLLRGCPSCWTIGLFQTIAAKLQGKSSDVVCSDGSCSVQPSRSKI